VCVCVQYTFYVAVIHDLNLVTCSFATGNRKPSQRCRATPVLVKMLNQ
jgi:hypothetical protein